MISKSGGNWCVTSFTLSNMTIKIPQQAMLKSLNLLDTYQTVLPKVSDIWGCEYTWITAIAPCLDQIRERVKERQEYFSNKVLCKKNVYKEIFPSLQMSKLRYRLKDIYFIDHSTTFLVNLGNAPSMTRNRCIYSKLTSVGVLSTLPASRRVVVTI